MDVQNIENQFTEFKSQLDTLNKKTPEDKLSMVVFSGDLDKVIAAFVIAALLGILIDQNGYRLLGKLPDFGPLGTMPAIKSPAWHMIDLTFGLLMVGVFEELVFRGYMLTFLRRYTQHPFWIILISSLAFGLIHWSLGLQAIIVTSLAGAAFMVIYLISRSLPPIMLAHFAVDFIDFSNWTWTIWIKSLFRFL